MADSEHSLQAVVFDLDGLMVNTEELDHQVGQILLERRGRDFSNELKRKMMGLPAALAFQRMIEEHGLEDTPEELQTEGDQLLAALLPNRLQTMPGLADLMDSLEKAGIPKAVATSSPRSFASTVLNRFHLQARFHFVLTSDDVHRAKPHPDIYWKAAELLGVPSGRMMVLEDSENGCRAAVQAGAWVVAVPAKHSCDHRFCGARLVANSLNDPRILLALGVDMAPRRLPLDLPIGNGYTSSASCRRFPFSS